MKLSKRLLSIASLVKPNDVIADIGCDHALLDIYLVKNKIIPKSLAIDVNSSALNNGIKNIKKYHLEGQISTKLSDGINDITEDINTLIISGMGANTIKKILNNSKIKQIDKLIIQSNTDYYQIRSFITSKGYIITHESVIYDKNKYYLNIVFEKGNQKYSIKELTYGPILMNGNSTYYEYLYNKNIHILENIPIHHVGKRFELIKSNFLLKKLKRK